ncbi:MAG: MbnP family protein [Bacteroidia bacterium]
MRKPENHRGVLTIIAFLLLITSVNAQSSYGTLSIDFLHYVDSDTLQLDTTAYKNAFGQTYSITKFKYYISNIELIKTTGEKTRFPMSFLIDEEKPESKNITSRFIPEGEYKSISFIIGVDSIHNCSGAQSGALDPVNTMFWTWNTGYIFLKLEGKAQSSTAPGKIFEYHIGGYKNPNNCIRKVELPFFTAIKITKSKTAELKLKVNIAEILRGPESIDFSKLPSVTDKNHATIMADNYKDIFEVIVR